MSIVGSIAILGGGHVVERFTDHLGQTYQQTYALPTGWGQAEADARLPVQAAALEAALAEGEALAVVQ